MNIQSTSIKQTNEKPEKQSNVQNPENNGKFAAELKGLETEESKKKESDTAKVSESESKNAAEKENVEKEKLESLDSEELVTEKSEVVADDEEALNKGFEINEETTIVETVPTVGGHDLTENSARTQKQSNPFLAHLQESKGEGTDGVTVLAVEDDTQEKLGDALNGLNSIVKEFNQSEDKSGIILNTENKNADIEDEDEALINNDFNINENKELTAQMSPNMNFSGDGQPFSSFMNNEAEQKKDVTKLSMSAKDLAEEAAVLSTMAENVAIANKNMALKEQAVEKAEIQKAETEQPKEVVVNKNDGIKKVDAKTNIVQETIVKYDAVIVNEADAEVFANLVEHGEVNMNNLAPQAAERAVHVSKTLADMLAKAMQDNKPVRIEFDNDISVIIRISRDGKLSADFLPSSQVAEAYLRENLPILRQKLNDQNIEYDELNQRERREQDREQNRKKGRSDE